MPRGATFERGVAGGDLVITWSFGHPTTITLDANGYVASIANTGGVAGWVGPTQVDIIIEY